MFGDSYLIGEEMSRRPKLRALWLKEGDKSTKSFHQVANFNRRNNSIESQLVHGSIFSDQTKIRDHIVQFYDRLFIEQFSWHPKLDGLAFDSIDDEEASLLERPFEESEVLEVVKGMNNEKVSVPVGCDQSYLGVFHDFHVRSKFEKKP